MRKTVIRSASSRQKFPLEADMFATKTQMHRGEVASAKSACVLPVQI
jgi:hypothetical protein